MLKYATVSLIVLGILSLVITEIVRSVVDRKRLKRDGLGGTQDIAIGGMVVGWLCATGAIVCGICWLIQQYVD